MSFAEKSAWSVLAALLLVYGGYAWVVGGWVRDDTLDEVAWRLVLLATTVPLVLALIVTHVVVAVLNPRSAGVEDERDRLFELRAERWGGLTLGAGVVGLLCLALLDASAFWIAHAALGTLVLAELVTSAGRIALYRTGG